MAVRPELKDQLAYVLREVKEQNIVKREELEECFLQVYLFAGFPAALEAFKALSRVGHATESTEPAPLDYDLFLERGQTLYKKIYAANSETVEKEMLKLSPDLALWAVVEGYGKTLSRPGLSSKVRELCIVAMLTQLGWSRQLFSHLLGAKHVGNTSEECWEACEIGSLGDDAKFQTAQKLTNRAFDSETI